MVKTHQPIQPNQHHLEVKKPTVDSSDSLIKKSKKFKLNIMKNNAHNPSTNTKNAKPKNKSDNLLPKRHVKRFKSTNIPKAVIKRLGRRAGIKRSTGAISNYIQKCIRIYLELVLRDALMYTDHDHHRKTIEERDIIMAVKSSTGARYLGHYTPKKSLRHMNDSVSEKHPKVNDDSSNHPNDTSMNDV